MEGERESWLMRFFTQKTFSEKAWAAAAPHVQIIVKKRRKKRDQPSFAEGGVFTYENESIIAI